MNGANLGYAFPAIRGVQAGREYYVSMCPLRVIPRIFLFDEEELPPQQRAQRILNKARVPTIAHYILDNPSSYVFSALTASIDPGEAEGALQFVPFGEEGELQKMGVLHVSMDARFIINDGQHRRAAIEMAMREKPGLGDETISVVFFLDRGLQRCQQMFADLNRHAIRPSRSLGLLYENRDDKAHLTKLVVLNSPVFREVVELERTTLALRSSKLFTLSAIYTATTALISGRSTGDIEKDAQTAISFWEEVAQYLPEWQSVRERTMKASEVRRQFIHSHGIVLHALGQVGNALLAEPESKWKRRVSKLKTIDWSKENAELWEGRALIGGRVSKANQNVTLTTNAIKTALGLPLSPEEERAERALERANHGRKRNAS